MNKINTFIFDFGGVLYKIDQKRTLKAFRDLSLQPGIINIEDINLNNVDFTINFETGRLTVPEFRTRVREELKLRDDTSDEEIDKAWNLTLVDIYPESVDIIKEYKNYGSVYLLSNTNIIHYEHFAPACRELFPLFNELYFSYKIGLRKPDENIFHFVLSQINAKPENIIFIDDSPPNIKAAALTGMNVLHCKSPSILSEFLHNVKDGAQHST